MDAPVSAYLQTYIHQHCTDTGCSLEDLLGTMNNRDGWWECQRTLCYQYDNIILFIQPLRSGRIWHKVKSKRNLTGLNSEFSSSTSCLTKAEEQSAILFTIAGGRIIGFIPFSRVLVLCEIQSVPSRIWTRVAVSNSYDDNHYTTGTSTR